MKMKIIAPLIILLALGMNVQGQSESLSKKELRKQARAEKKRAAEEEAAKSFELTKAMVTSARFVLETDRLTDPQGFAYNVQSELNYIQVDSLFGVIQTGNTRTTDGNGIGGGTKNGEVKNYRYVFLEKRKAFTIKFDLYDRTASSSITISVSSSGFATAMVRDNILDVVYRFTGDMVPLHESNIYKGPRSL